ncbi:UDP-glucuronosyltransferase 3A2-like [Mus pahari]|uniref:UDP-glucuronosyltransferase 3A2-like n=1 Tax=Mus pahari TaxID=10093 RepID=UPI000A30FE28|nr:UDP-glucuronosyltransferase 3A2-like [Mus pahari]
MAPYQGWLLMSFFFLEVLLLEAAKILTISTLSGSHYIMISRVSQVLHGGGHNVTKLLYESDDIPDFRKEKPSYQVINWRPPEDQEKKFDELRHRFKEEMTYGRSEHNTLLKIHRYFGDLCSHLLSRKDIMEFLKDENFDLVLIDSVDICALLTVEKLGKRFVSFLPCQFSYIDFALPSAPLSYAPVYGSGLTDQMDFWGRVKNFLMFFDFSMKQREILSQYDSAIQEHFAEGSRPVLSELLLKAELWFVNSDFALDFARPLFPNTVYVGGLLDKPVQPIPQELENFISQFGDSGFVLVALGSIVSMLQTKEIIKEMNSAFARLPQGVLWTCKASQWPKDVSLAPNVKIMDWLPQTDLLAHPSIRLFVTHGGTNSVMEAVQHGVPMVGIPFFADQPENMVRVEAKNLGVSIQLQSLKAESFALTMKEVIEDKRYAALWVVVPKTECWHDRGISLVCFPAKPEFCGMCFSMFVNLEVSAFPLLLIPILSEMLKDVFAYGGMMFSFFAQYLYDFSYFG